MGIFLGASAELSCSCFFTVNQSSWLVCFWFSGWGLSWFKDGRKWEEGSCLLFFSRAIFTSSRSLKALRANWLMTSKKKIDTFNNNNKIFLQQVSCPEEQIPFIHAIFGETVSRKKAQVELDIYLLLHVNCNVYSTNVIYRRFLCRCRISLL